MSTIANMKAVGTLGADLGIRQSEEAKAKKEVNAAADRKAVELSKQLLQSSVGVDLSPQSKDKAAAHRRAFEIAKATPDIREDRVAELRQKIAAGQYSPDSEKIADGILREAVMEQLASLPDEPA